MRILFLLILSIPTFCFAQEIEIDEQSITVCYVGDAKRPNVIAINKISAEIDEFKIEGYLDCSSPMSEACGEIIKKKYKANSIKINDEIIELGTHLNGESISRFNVGRFFYAEGNHQKFIILEMADLDCPNVPDNYCYIIICLDEHNKKTKNIVYGKENNPISESELKLVLKSINQEWKLGNLS